MKALSILHVFALRYDELNFFLLAIFLSVTSSLAVPLKITEYNSTDNLTGLENLALEKILQDAAPIFGIYEKVNSDSSEWMKKYSDDKLLVQMNLPGTHDSQTWNYSSSTQKKLSRITRFRGTFVAPAKFYRCQQSSIVEMLNRGIRVFDLRFAFDVTKTVLVFWHGQALQSQTATVESVLFAFYKWLEDHPTEALFISLKYEGYTTLKARNNKALQLAIFEILTSKSGERYFVKKQNELGTLGEARGKITLLRRFDLDLLPDEFENRVPGIYFPPSKWKVNGDSIALIYNPSQNRTAFIEDYYHLKPKSNHRLEASIDLKYNVVVDHLRKAATRKDDSLYWTFASGERNLGFLPHYPEKIALGTESVEGMNQRLVGYFRTQKKARLGIVMFDFFDQPPDLIDSFLEISEPSRPGSKSRTI